MVVSPCRGDPENLSHCYKLPSLQSSCISRTKSFSTTLSFRAFAFCETHLLSLWAKILTIIMPGLSRPDFHARTFMPGLSCRDFHAGTFMPGLSYRDFFMPGLPCRAFCNLRSCSYYCKDKKKDRRLLSEFRVGDQCGYHCSSEKRVLLLIYNKQIHASTSCITIYIMIFYSILLLSVRILWPIWRETVA